MPMDEVNEILHPLIQHKLTLMRSVETPTGAFRGLLAEISMLLAYEVTRDLQTTTKRIETPLMAMDAPILDESRIVLISILRAGNGLLDGMLRILPEATVGHVGLYRDPKTLQAVEYYFKMPPDMTDREAVVLDPMLATGASGIVAVEKIKATNPRSIRFVCLVAAPEGIKAMRDAHPDVRIFTAKVDKELNEKGYILPGLGDAGDRMFGTA
ncbi:MAG: uracil phosphoribosyltransferase [Myxococcota bacterium]